MSFLYTSRFGILSETTSNCHGFQLAFAGSEVAQQNSDVVIPKWIIVLQSITTTDLELKLKIKGRKLT